MHNEIKKSKFESRKEKIIPLKKFFLRLGRFATFAIVLIAFSVGIGTIGYHDIADLNYIYSFHMACMILTGMGPVSVMETNASKMFSSFYALYSGIAFLSITAVFFAPIIHRLLHILQVEEDE